MSELHFTVAELERRLLNIVRFGTVASVNTSSKTCRVKLNDTLTTGDLPWAVRRAGRVRTASAPSVGEQVTVIAPAGELSQAVVFLAIYQSAFDAPSTDPDDDWVQYADGAVIHYNQRSHSLQASLPAGGTVTVQADGGITLIGDVTINGTLHTTGDTVAGSVSLQQHVHGGIQPGGANTGVAQ